ncbi:hypothetical protein [Acidithiobacillus sp.]|uniref:hypothetical protein n=1 Tax=Acidithiobacillus sp. TaxID=1872118 RepID=UPI003D060F26
MEDDDLMSGLNDLVNQADKPVTKQTAAQPVKPAIARKEEAPAKPVQTPTLVDKPVPKRPMVPAQGDAPVSVPAPAPECPPTPERPSSISDFALLVGAAFLVLAFAVGIGYGAIIASGKYPFWSAPGTSGVLTDWLAAPAGVLLLPIISALLALGGRELHRDGKTVEAKVVACCACLLMLTALFLPFLV